MEFDIASGTLLRVRMSRWDEMPELDAAEPPVSATAERRAIDSRRERAESSRNVIFEVVHRGSQYGPFTVPVDELRIPRDGAGLRRLSEWASIDPIDGVVEQARAWAGESLDREWLGRLVVAPIRRRLDPVFVPFRVLDVLARCTKERGPTEPLWLEIADPPGYLTLVPWERLLYWKLRVPVLRIGQHRVKAVTYSGCLDVVVCASAASRRDLLPVRLIVRLLQSIANSGHDARVHVFADDSYFAGLAKAFPLRVAKNAGDIAVYSPPGSDVPPQTLFGSLASRFRHGPVRPPEAQDHPWLRWIRGYMNDWAADVVHCICSGAVFEEYGTVVCSAVPRSSIGAASRYRLAHFVSPLETDGFCSQLGAWALVISSAGGRISRYGLRMHLDEVSRLRPGFVALHDAKEDPSGRVLADLYRYMAGDRPPVGATALSVTANEVNPWLLAARDAETAETRGLAEEIRHFQSMLANAGPVSEASPSIAKWAARSQRIMEQNAAGALAAGPKSEVELATQRGVVEALSLVASLLTDRSMRDP